MNLKHTELVPGGAGRGGAGKRRTGSSRARSERTARAALPGRTRRPAWGLRLSIGYLALLLLVVAVEPLLPLEASRTELTNTFAPPSLEHPFGTDGSGRDLLARVVAGARLAVIAPLLIVVVSAVVGGSLGLVAAWRGGVLEAIIVRVCDALLGFPGLLLAILAVGLFGAGIAAPVAALIIATSPYFAVMVRGLARGERNLGYVGAYRLSGFSSPWIVTFGVLPNISAPIVGQAGFSFGYALIDLSALSYLGLGVQPPGVDWGLLVNEGRSALLAGHPLPVLVPSLAVVLTLICVNRVGDELNGDSGRNA